MKEKRLTIFYNVENLFDTADDPKSFDEEFTPNGKKHWTEGRYQNKIKKISSVLLEIEKQNEANALFIGLSEIENQKVLDDLLELLPGKKSIHFDSKDERGIDVALLYEEKDFLLTHSEALFVELENADETQDFTRDILYVNGFYQNQLVHVFVLHLPSMRNQDINKAKRTQAIKLIKERVENIYASEPQPSVILMGDFNENPDSENLKKVLKTQETEQNIPADDIYNPFETLFNQKSYSLMHKNQGLLFDQILLSKFLLNDNSQLNFTSAHVFKDKMVEEWDKKYAGSPFRTYAGNDYLGGYSDHFPVYIIFN